MQTLICGNLVFDFYELEKSVIYKNGYSKESLTIKAFWEIVHDFSEEDKKSLLFFITGSDRAPVRGLATLNIIIERNGDNLK